jgi:hypothetical protein
LDLVGNHRDWPFERFERFDRFERLPTWSHGHKLNTSTSPTSYCEVKSECCRLWRKKPLIASQIKNGLGISQRQETLRAGIRWQTKSVGSSHAMRRLDFGSSVVQLNLCYRSMSWQISNQFNSLISLGVG